MEDDLKYFGKCKMTLNICVTGRRPQIFSTWKTSKNISFFFFHCFLKESYHISLRNLIEINIIITDGCCLCKLSKIQFSPGPSACCSPPPHPHHCRAGWCSVRAKMAATASSGGRAHEGQLCFCSGSPWLSKHPSVCSPGAPGRPPQIFL